MQWYFTTLYGCSLSSNFLYRTHWVYVNGSMSWMFPLNSVLSNEVFDAQAVGKFKDRLGVCNWLSLAPTFICVNLSGFLRWEIIIIIHWYIWTSFIFIVIVSVLSVLISSLLQASVIVGNLLGILNWTLYSVYSHFGCPNCILCIDVRPPPFSKKEVSWLWH